MTPRLIRAAVLAATLGTPLAAQAPAPLRARLSPVPLDIAMQAAIAGRGEATATLTGTRLAITGSFSGLKSPATAARLHESPNRGIRGAAIADLTATPALAGTLGGEVTLTEAHADAFRKGLLYVQLHSEKAPEGNLWGWLLPASPATRPPHEARR